MKQLLILTCLSVLLYACTNTTKHNSIVFKKNEYIGEWPFSVDEVEVFCNGYKEIYCTASNGKTYALNGSAKGISKKDPSINKVEEIWLDDPNYPELKIPYTDFISQGLTLCEIK